MRYMMSVVGLDAGAKEVKGTHGLMPSTVDDGPVWLCNDPELQLDSVDATDVKGLLLRLAGLT